MGILIDCPDGSTLGPFDETELRELAATTEIPDLRDACLIALDHLRDCPRDRQN
jgi:hypothetical protein